MKSKYFSARGGSSFGGKKIFAVLFVGFLFFNFIPTVSANSEKFPDQSCSKAYKTLIDWDKVGCNADKNCIMYKSATGEGCVPKTSSLAEEQVAAANVIVSMNCPTGSKVYAPNATNSTIINALYAINYAVGWGKLDKPQGCLKPFDNETAKSCINKSIAYDGNNPIGCWVAPLSIVRQGEEDGSVFYNALQAIYDTGVGWTSGLLSKAGRTPYKVIVDIPCDKAIVNIIGGANCDKTKDYADSIPKYVARLYQFGFGIVGVVALLMIIIGAAKYTLSAGSFTSKDEAKQDITEAIYGILLLFGAYLILYTINPGLVSIKAPTLTPVNVEKFLAAPKTQTSAPTSNTPAESSGTNSIANCDTVGSGTEGTANDPRSVSICFQCHIGFKQSSDKKSCAPICEKNNTINSDKVCDSCAKAKKDVEDLKKPQKDPQGNSLPYLSGDEVMAIRNKVFPNYAKDCQ